MHLSRGRCFARWTITRRDEVIGSVTSFNWGTDYNHMVELEISSERKRTTFSIRSMMLATLVVCWTLAVNRWLGDGYGWRTAIACGILGSVVLLVDLRAMFGLLIGSLAVSLVGYLFIVGHQPPSPRFFKAMILMASYGAAAGAGVHAMILGKRWTGAFALVLALVAFAVILYIN